MAGLTLGQVIAGQRIESVARRGGMGEGHQQAGSEAACLLDG